MSKLLKFVIGFITGALAGGIAALLLATKTGFELRRDIQTDVEGWIKEAESTICGNYILLETLQKVKWGNKRERNHRIARRARSSSLTMRYLRLLGPHP